MNINLPDLGPKVAIVLRYGLAGAGMWVVSKGVLPQSCVDQAETWLAANGIAIPAGSGLFLAVTAWGLLSHKQQTTAVKEAAVTGVPLQAGVFTAVTPSPAAQAVAANTQATGAKTS